MNFIELLNHWYGIISLPPPAHRRSRYIFILKLPTGSCGLDDAASFTRVSDTWCGAHWFPLFSNSLPRISVSDTVRARAHNYSTHAHVQTCSFQTLEERGGESSCFVCSQLEHSRVSCQCEDFISAVTAAVPNWGKPVQDQTGLCEITTKTNK